ncbi:sigma-70 family RNA polymerase sigma factor [Singulisphaera acidiphila]|uniref:RNA polymerase sigma factor, sigma-70 family n=1 Tax=Singulisphaera acidiphila (strain ATCC BAA-1392 / DSM 18658 / VKM B-2454 / MOB10) TaxID=886293 RepID=L0DD82_SINAD|nr:sigma-70 family RNA polymerase sigma factor [Singulisphaera acidiphila]AGA26815.1 RNA polymerase sigma factor, sigma-70 family [Singulisphaera acidiphila DSM 18658]
MANGQSHAVPKRSGLCLDAELSDSQLLGRFNARRDESAEMAFADLVRRHGPMVLRVCHQILGNQHNAEDAFQAAFLVLARRSGSIEDPDLLGNWLYGVALRTAWEAKLRDGRRQLRETPAWGTIQGEPSNDEGRPDLTLICREELEVLHEEVSRLPERYRIPVVLCELQGLTYQEAARRMRCPASTIGVRLSRARQRLRLRMIRRGILPAAALTHAMFGAEGASTLVSSALVRTTVRGAAGFAASDTAATGLISASVVTLAVAVLKTRAVTRLKVATNLVLAVGITATMGWVTVHQPPRVRSSIDQNPPPSKSAPASSRNEAVTTIPGRPLANSGAKVAHTVDPEIAHASPKTDPQGGKTIVEVVARSADKPEAQVTLTRLNQPSREVEARGQLLFAKEWSAKDGLGPVYNETSCVACHGLGAPGGAGPENKNVVIITAIAAGGRGSPKGLDRIHPGFRGTRSTVLHRFGTDPTYGSWRRGFFEAYRDKTATPSEVAGDDSVDAHIQRLAAETSLGRRLRERSSRLQPTPGLSLNVSERNSPALFGAGQIDAIPSVVLIDEAKRQPAEVRGRVSRDPRGRIGRFGWKAQISSLHEFVRGACASELGLEVTGHPQGVSPLAPDAKAKGLDLIEPECDALVAYVRSLPAPVVVDPSGPHGTQDMSEGRRLFAEVGCATCHTPSLGKVRGIYSDLLLHEMGQSLSDSGNYYWTDGSELTGGPRPGEWRTPPLWGFRDSGPYMHDGRAQTLEEAIALHRGQAANVTRRFFSLTSQEQSQIEAFLKSLVAPSAASTPGVMLAAELESRIEPEEVREAEALVRRQREEAAARDEQEQQEARRRQLAMVAAKRADRQFPIARNLEKLGKIPAALEFYREIALNAPDTEVGRLAAVRITAIAKDQGSP